MNNKFYYYDKLKKRFIFLICFMILLPIELILTSKVSIINRSDIMVKLSIMIMAVMVVGISHLFSKRICYHEGRFEIKKDKAIIYMKNKTHEIFKDEVEKVVFNYSPGFRVRPAYYYFEVKYSNKKCKIILDQSDYSYDRNIEKINLYKLYSFLNSNRNA